MTKGQDEQLEQLKVAANREKRFDLIDFVDRFIVFQRPFMYAVLLVIIIALIVFSPT